MSFSDDFTFTRGTGATRINAAGLIVGVDFSSTSNTIGTGAKTFTLTADANVNRDWPVGSAVRVVDQVSGNTMEGTVTTYTPSTQALVLDITSVTGSGTFTNWRIGSLEVRRDADGVLREPLRSNLTGDSESAAWGNANVNLASATSNSILFEPTGSVRGVLIVENTANGNHRLSRNITSPSGIRHILSAWFKPKERTSAVINYGGANAVFSLSGAGSVISQTAGVTAIITPDIGGWYLCSLEYTGDGLSSSSGFGMASGSQTSYLGDGVSGIYVTGMMYYQGNGRTSYIPTTTVAVTRNADTFTFTPAAIAKFRQGQGALVIEANASDAGTAQRAALRLTGPSGEIRFGKQGVVTTGNFTKMAEGGGVQLLGNATQGVTNNGLDYTLMTPTNTRTGAAMTPVLQLNAVAYNGSSEFGAITFTNTDAVFNATASTVDFKGFGSTVLNGAHYNGTRFIIATGTAGIVCISTDGLSYRLVNTPVITQACNEVTSGMVGPTLRNVIVGSTGFIATSDDNGETWTSRTSGTAVAILGATRSTTNFVISLNSGSSSANLRTSADGITWNAVANSGVSQVLVDVHANGAQVVAVGVNGAITVSNDNGATWAQATSSQVVTTQALNGVHYNASAGLWVAVGGNGTIITATDPTGTWTLQTSGVVNSLLEVNYFNGLWIASIQSSTTILTSPNAVTWTLRSIGTGTVSIVGIAASATRLIITGILGSFLSSEDGLTYTSRTNNNATLNGIAYGAGVYVSVGNAVNGSGYIATIDGAGTVTRRTSGTTQNLLNAKFVRSAHYAVGNASVLSRSTDGATWSTQTVGGTAFNITDIADSGSLMIAVGSGGRYSTSANGTTFANSALNGQTTQQLNGIEFANGSFVIVGNAGVILTTTNGTTYTLRTSGTTQTLTSVMYSTRDQRWYAAGNAGTLLYSEDNGVTWASVNNAGFGAVSNTTLQASKLLPQWKSGRNTMALSYKANEVIVGLNGVAVTDTTASIPSITGGVLGESFNGKIGPVYFYEFPKTLEEIKAITGVTA